MKFQIKRSTTADTRMTNNKNIVPDRDVLLAESRQHSSDVINLFHYFLRKEIIPDVSTHDWTKIKYIDLFLDNFKFQLIDGGKFKDHKWWKKHVNEEPHHALDYTGARPIHLGHVLHMLCDWVAAGKARSKDGNFVMTFKRDGHTEDDVRSLLFKAFLNTIDWLNSNTSVVKSEVKAESGVSNGNSKS